MAAFLGQRGQEVRPTATCAMSGLSAELLEVDFGARRARLNGVDVPLTRREFEVLAYYARNAGKIMLHRQVLQAVWGGQYGDEDDYVWTFVQRIRRKIEPDRRMPRYLISEAGIGYRMPPPEDQPMTMTSTDKQFIPP